MISTIIDRLGEWNSQLFRELKGRLKTRNLTITAAISVCGQLLLYLFYQSLLPQKPVHNIHGRYCTGSESYNNKYHCLTNLQEHFIINWQLWWFDLFICMSIIGIFALLVVGTYMLIADLSKEERRGTLGFIRLSPQSVSSILTGKMLGVPILLYLFCVLALPLHIGAGLAAQIPLSLILGFYAVLAASCIFFYSAALLYGLVSPGLGGFQAWLGSGSVLFALFFFMAISSEEPILFENPADWLRLFFPGTMLSYLVDAVSLSVNRIDYFFPENLLDLRWYELNLWSNTWLGIGLIIFNYAFWTYWIWQGLQHRFYNQSATLLTKKESYWLSTSLTAIMLGFVLQTTNYHQLFESFGILFIFELVLFLGLIAALSPHRQTLQDWARFRHLAASSKRRNILQDLIWGEKSPSTVAIAINLVITGIIILPGIVLLPLDKYKIPVLLGLLVNVSVILIYATFAQMMLLMKTRKRAIWAAGTVSAMIVLPVVIMALFRMEPSQTPAPFLFSALPILGMEYATGQVVLLSLLGEWLAIALAGFQMTRQLRQAGASATKVLLSQG